MERPGRSGADGWGAPRQWLTCALGLVLVWAPTVEVEVQRAVSGSPVSLGFVPFAHVDASLVKVLLVDGWAPNDPSYPIG